MPVSKKRKKDGKPVHRKATAPVAGAEPARGPEPGVAPLSTRPAMGKPTNPFVAQQQGRRGSQRGR
ncbi:MAG TPA: hypothetical protein VMK12_24405 [Anaeromyxobacteraceae bacterium]|nr:hypothetical protein [Anaeromyxobacteraceae bacterium]